MSFTIANAAAKGEWGRSAIAPPKINDDGDLDMTCANIAAEAPGLIAPSGVGDGTSSSSKSTRPCELGDKSSSISFSSLPFSNACTLDRFLCPFSSCNSVASLAGVGPFSTRSVNIFGVFTPIESLSDGLPRLDFSAMDFLPSIFDSFLCSFVAVVGVFAFRTTWFEFWTHPRGSNVGVGAPSARAPLTLVKLFTQREQPRGE